MPATVAAHFDPAGADISIDAVSAPRLTTGDNNADKHSVLILWG
jgi:hypothetical protein